MAQATSRRERQQNGINAAIDVGVWRFMTNPRRNSRAQPGIVPRKRAPQLYESRCTGLRVRRRRRQRRGRRCRVGSGCPFSNRRSLDCSPSALNDNFNDSRRRCPVAEERYPRASRCRPRRTPSRLSRDRRPDRRATLEKLRRTIRAIVPEAEECISYRIPAFRLGGKVVAGHLCTRGRVSYFPFSGATFRTLARRSRPTSTRRAVFTSMAQRASPPRWSASS